jgi:hypothetical protein
MKIINMIEQYRVLCNESKTIGNFAAYQNYVGKYKPLFDSVFSYLYMTDLSAIQPLVEMTDFDVRLQNAEENLAEGQGDAIIKLVSDVNNNLGFKEDFDLYLGMELGNIGGCALKAERPFIYIAIDKPLNENSLQYLVPHEFNHMVRLCAASDVDMFDFMERTLSEGLGTYAPIAHGGLPYCIDTIAKTLGLPAANVKDLIDNKKILIEMVAAHFGDPLTPELMRLFFTYEDVTQENCLAGYFVGIQVVHELVEAGNDFAALTVMPAEELWEMHQSNC